MVGKTTYFIYKYNKRRKERFLNLNLNLKRNMLWTEEEIKFLTENYNSISLYEDLPNRTILGINDKLKKLKLKRTPIKNNKFSLKFLMDDNNINYYLYGFLMADGYLTDKIFRLRLAEKDLNHLEKISKYFINVKIKKETNNIKTFKDKDKTYLCSDTYKMEICDYFYAKKLKEKLNITIKKTYNPPCLDYLNTPEKFLSFFVGFIDGDGSFTKRSKKDRYKMSMTNHISWMGNYKFFSDKLIEYYDIKCSIYIDKRGYSCLEITQSGNVIKLKTEMLKLNIPFMERKWDKISTDESLLIIGYLRNNKDLIKSMIKSKTTYIDISKILNVDIIKLTNFIYNNKLHK